MAEAIKLLKNKAKSEIKRSPSGIPTAESEIFFFQIAWLKSKIAKNPTTPQINGKLTTKIKSEESKNEIATAHFMAPDQKKTKKKKKNKKKNPRPKTGDGPKSRGFFFYVFFFLFLEIFSGAQ